MTISQTPLSTQNNLQADLRQRIFAGAMGTCVLEWRGQSLKVIARDQELQGLPETGQVWLNWTPEQTIPIDRSPS